MYRTFSALVFVISLLLQSKFAWSENYDFRHTKWGMTPEEVIASEEKMDPVEKNKNVIQYKTRILEKDVELSYLFVENKLVGAIYKLDENYLNSEHFIQTYSKFQETLARKYGQPSKESTNWVKNTYKNDRKKWGLAISLGHLEYASSWETQRTTIECSLREVNYYVLCSVEYWSLEFSHLLNETNKENRSDVTKLEDKLDPL